MRSQPEARRRRQGALKRLALFSAMALPCLTALSVLQPAQATTRSAPRPGIAAEVRSIYPSEWGMPRPLAVAYRPASGRLVVAGRAGDDVRILELDLIGHRKGSFRLPRLRQMGALAFDPNARRLRALGNLGLRAPRAATFDPGTGAWYVLDRDGVTRIAATGRTRRIDLGSLDATAIAFHPGDDLLYVSDRTGQRLVGLDDAGTVRRTYVMGSVRLRDVRSMVFAPSADTTDDPSQLDLYVADRGNAETLGRIAEVRLSEPDRVVAAATTQPATLVQTIRTSAWNPASPDPSGIVYRPAADRFTVVDSEVDETTGAGYHNVNMWQITRSGAVTDTGTTYLPAPNFTREPTGAGFIAATNTLLVSTDSGDEVYFDRPGSDGRFGTGDDVVTSIDTNALGGFQLGDTEDPEYDPITGHLFILDGVSVEVYDVNPVDGIFGNGNDTVTHFDIGQYGPTDVEGLSSDPSRNTLLVGEKTPQERIFEVTKTGSLVRIIDTASISALDNISGLALGPASDGSGQQNYWIVDRKVDNGSNASENDGLLFEIAAPVAGSNTAPVLGAIGNKSVNELATLSFTATATDPNVPPQVLTYSLVGAPTGASIGATTGAFTWTPTEAQGPGSYPFQVCVSDGVASDCESITVTVAEVNVPPVLNAIGNKSVNEGVALSFTATSSDTDAPAQARTYSLVGAPTGAAIGATTGAFSWTPAEAQGPGSYPFQVCVSDGVASTCEAITVTVAEVNVAPVLSAIGNKSVNESATLSFTATATDADVPGQALAYTLVGNPTGSSIAPTTGAFTWTPTEAQGPGSYPFQVCASDGVVSDCESITVTVAEVNVPPVLNAIGNESVNEGAALGFTATSSDVDVPTQTRTYALVGNPTGSSIGASTGVFAWTPTEAQGPGSYAFQVCVSDGVASTCESITVTVAEVNTAPTLDPIGNKSVNEGAALSFTATSSDTDVPAQARTYALVGAPTGASIGATSGAFTWTPTEAQGPGSYPFQVCVSDGVASTCEAITVTVAEVDAAPVLDPIGDKSVNEGATLSFTASATDADGSGQPLTFSLVGAPTGASIGATSGAFTWTPTEAQGPGSYPFQVCVSDGVATTCESITVTVAEVNAAPVLDPIGDKAVDEATLLTFTATSSDGDLPAQTRTYSLFGNPTGSSIESSTGAFTWTPTEAQGPGSYPFQVCVSDGVATTCESITVTVAEVNAPPVLDAIGDKVVSAEAELAFTAGATDADLPADTLAFSLTGAPAGASIGSSSGAFSWTPASDQTGDHTFDVCVSDGTAQDCETVTVTVTPPNIPPILDPIGDLDVDELQQLAFTATASDPQAPPQTLTFSLSGAPAGASIGSSTGAFTWTPTESQGPGSPGFDVCVSDGVATDCETIVVTVAEVNVAPELDPLGDATVNEGSELTFTASAHDADEPANTLTFSLVDAPVAATIGPHTGVFSWTPGSVDVGTHAFDVCVSDGSVPDCRSVTVTVNDRPVLDPIGPLAVDELAELTFTATASDADVPAQSLTFSLSGAPAGATIDATTGAFSWTPTEAQGPASRAFQTCVTDGLATDCVTVDVDVAEVNVAPVLAAIGDKTVNEGTLLSFSATAGDADLPANGLTFSLTDAPAGATIGAATGAFTWTPTEAQGPGVAVFDVCVSDGSAQDCETVSVTVLDPVIFGDDFESGTLAAWVNTGMVVQQQEVANGAWAARATSTGSKVYAVATLPAPRWEVFYRTRVKVLTQSAHLTYLVRLQTRSGVVGGVFRAANGYLGVRSNPASQRFTSSTYVTTGVWHDLQVRVLVNGSNGSAEVWFDGVHIGDLAVTANFGTKQIAKVMLGDDQGGRSYDFVFDDVAVDSALIGP